MLSTCRPFCFYFAVRLGQTIEFRSGDWWGPSHLAQLSSLSLLKLLRHGLEMWLQSLSCLKINQMGWHAAVVATPVQCDGKAPPHTLTSSMLHSGNHACRDYLFRHSRSQIWTHQTKAQISTGLSIPCVSWAQTNLFFFFLNSGFLAAIWP